MLVGQSPTVPSTTTYAPTVSFSPLGIFLRPPFFLVDVYNCSTLLSKSVLCTLICVARYFKVFAIKDQVLLDPNSYVCDSLKAW